MSKDNVVMVIQVGGKNFQPIVDVSIPIISEYAHRINADFKLVTDAKYNLKSDSRWPYIFEKFQCQDLLKEYRRVLYIDADMLITPACPNLFDLVPFQTLGVTWTPGMLLGSIAQLQHRFGYIGWNDTYFDSGLILTSQCHLPYWNLATTLARGGDFVNDEAPLNFSAQLLRIPMQNMGNTFSHTFLTTRTMRERYGFKLPVQLAALADYHGHYYTSDPVGTRLAANIIHYGGGLPEGYTMEQFNILRATWMQQDRDQLYGKVSEVAVI